MLCCATHYNQMYGPPAGIHAVLSDHKHHSINIKHYCKACRKILPQSTKTGFLLDRLTGYQVTRDCGVTLGNDSVYKQFKKKPYCLQPPWTKSTNAFTLSCIGLHNKSYPRWLLTSLRRSLTQHVAAVFTIHLAENCLNFIYRAKIYLFFSPLDWGPLAVTQCLGPVLQCGPLIILGCGFIC